ncbi:MAG: glycerol-3-phosphate acyltransferase [Chloroflexi bacterium]|nr:glycerol-3-phosphate acyltransferase [Chloroflexota bacterium]MBI4198374.1 glycerol-3-phosphate acyltransferase [Chloroflexota bacterium]
MLPTDTYQALLVALTAAYLLGSFPTAVLVSRLRGVDIFSAGPGLAGATNVFRQVGPVEGIVVLLVDAAKGALAIGVAYRLGLSGDLLLLPALASVFGHWRPIFTRFRGGDGVATLVGITFALFPLYVLPSFAVAFVVGSLARLTGKPVPTLWGGVAGYGLLFLRLPASQESAPMVIGVVLLAMMVLAHGVIGHRRRRAA